MKILTPISTRLELVLSAVLAASCHAALFGLMPAAADTMPEIRMSAYKQDLEITLIPSQPPVRERAPDPVREVTETVVREKAPCERQVLRKPVAASRERVPERTERAHERVSEKIERTRTRTAHERRKDLPVREDAPHPEERLLVIREKGNDPNEALTRDVSYTVDTSKLVYPRFALEENIEGQVLLWVHIAVDGSVEEVRLARSSGYSILDSSGARQVKNLARFQCAMNRGRPVDMWVEVPVRFSLNGGTVSLGNGIVNP